MTVSHLPIGFTPRGSFRQVVFYRVAQNESKIDLRGEMRKAFKKSYHDEFCYRVEFEEFKRRYVSSLESKLDAVKDADFLKASFGFFVMPREDGFTFQADFGKRPMGRLTTANKPAWEKGPTLLYSLGPGSITAITIYPAQSDVSKVPEKQIFLYIGRLTAWQLSKRMKGDLKSLVAYGFVSSFDAEATWQQRLRIWWLRLTHPTVVDDRFLPPRGSLGTAAAFTTKNVGLGLLVGIARASGPILLATVLLYFGFADLAHRFTCK